MDTLKELNQPHLRLPEEPSHKLYEQVQVLESTYPGGVRQYVKNAKQLLENAEKNPYADYQINVPVGYSLDFYDQDQIDKLEAIGIKEICQACFVLVAGGLGERLGYKGVKIRIPFELITETTYIQYYIEYILAFQSKGNTEIPLVIMVSDDTHDLTVEYLNCNNNFGMKKDQIIILKQQKVPALINKEAFLSQQEDSLLETKPHGHGDVHLLLSQSGLVSKWHQENKKWVIFIQDTNAAVFRSLPSVLGISHSKNLEMNSITIPRYPGEAIGAICQLQSGSSKITINVEYNQIQSLFSGPEPTDSQGFSLFPGNTNCLVFSIPEYNATLQKTQGLIAEFINPKYQPNSNTFKSSARLECMMQDYPKLLNNCDRVGFTMIQRLFCFSPCKNNLETSVQKAMSKLPQESAVSAEDDYYLLNQEILKICGVQLEGPAYVVLKPSLGVTFKEIKEKIKGINKISANSAIVLYDGIENLNLNGSLVVKNHAANLIVENKSYPEKLSIDNNSSEHLKIRGYSIKQPTYEII